MRKTNYSTTRRNPGLVAFVVGGFVGGLVALLYAPRTGSEARAYLMNEGKETADWMRRSLHEAQEAFLAKFEEAQSRLESMNRDTRERIRNFEEAARRMTEEERRNIGSSAGGTDDFRGE